VDRGSIGTARAHTVPERPTWQVALIAVGVLLVVSEVACLLIALVAKSTIDGGATAHDGALGALSNAFFMYSENDSGQPVFMAKGFFLLPGFNTLFYLVFGQVSAEFLVPFVTSGLAALLVAMLMVLGYLTMTVGRGLGLKLLLAFVCALGWVVLYTIAEASMFGGSAWTTIMTHATEVPTAFLSLLAVSLFTRRSG
jgi:hypothetical protein